jgi:hypothetical protein
VNILHTDAVAILLSYKVLDHLMEIAGYDDKLIDAILDKGIHASLQ